MKIIEIDSKYRLNLTGIYNAGVLHCPNCSNDLSYKDMLGFSEWYGNTVLIQECSNCFEKSFFHADAGTYKFFLEIIKLKLLRICENN
jgi:hypothetical protein